MPHWRGLKHDEFNLTRVEGGLNKLKGFLANDVLSRLGQIYDGDKNKDERWKIDITIDHRAQIIPDRLSQGSLNGQGVVDYKWLAYRVPIIAATNNGGDDGDDGSGDTKDKCIHDYAMSRLGEVLGDEDKKEIGKWEIKVICAFRATDPRPTTGGCFTGDGDMNYKWIAKRESK